MNVTNLTPTQKELADLLLRTKTHAKVLRRKAAPGGSFNFYHMERDTSPIDFPANEEEFAIKVHERKPDAPLSPIYVNLRNLPEKLLNKIGDVLSQVEMDEKVDVCTGIPKTAIAMAEKFSDRTKISFVDVFEKIGQDTNRKIIIKDGAMKGKGKRLLIIDDVVSQGGSKFEAIQAAEDLGYYVSILVLIDREQGGAIELRKRGINVHAALTITNLLAYYLSKNMITQKQYEETTDYIAASR